MPTISSPATPAFEANDVRAHIARAAAATGMDFDYLLAQAQVESGLDPAARAPTSSARGLYQFIDSTWLDMIDRHGDRHDLAALAAQIERGASGPFIRDPGVRQAVLALRDDPAIASLMAGEFARENRAHLLSATGREPGETDLYLAHFLGPDGAARFLSHAAVDPGASAAALFPKAAASNRAIFYGPGGARSLAEVHDHFTAKLAAGGLAAGKVPFAVDAGTRFASARAGFASGSTFATASRPFGATDAAAAGDAPRSDTVLRLLAARAAAAGEGGNGTVGAANPRHARLAYLVADRWGGA